ncbi:methionine--tRNA ligase, mitochondrial-like [Diachasmimorpha longicaudata]|uniref:methionine--tRNA ligase, mitochondrial-like n=1 Tax=Diachasmimorpha longicaudata TaxID=58733 RepID=UPI0030B8A3BF
MANLFRLPIVRNLIIQVHKNQSRNIMTTPARAKKLLESLKDNPYFDKYAGAITRLQETNPEEFVSRIVDQQRKAEEKKEKAKTFKNDATAKPALKPSMQRSQARLSDVMKTELLEDKVGLFLKPWMKLQTRLYSNYERKFAFVSTPIFYVNAGPHIGHLYSATMADAVVRYNKMLGLDTFFSTGTDEHGNKVMNAAISKNSSPSNYCEEISQLFRGMCDDFNVGYSKFIRTTDEEHRRGVHTFWTHLHNSGHIYLGKYSGWYCTSDEAFVPPSDLEDLRKPDGSTIKISSASGNPVEWMEEENYKFRLSSFQDDLKHWLKDEKSVQPLKFHRILSNWVEEGSCLNDLSVSRPASRAPWGIKVPNDASHTVYVWLDALINYLTVLGYPEDKYKKFWPPKVQVIGKDILKFHGIYWPAFLIAAGMEPPRTLLCHSHWTVNDEKMSKSKGNVIAPSKAAEMFTPDGLRYFLLREAVPHSDANYNEEKIRKILNAELADTLGNLFSRCMGKAVNPRGIIPEASVAHKDILRTEEAENLVESLRCLPAIAQESYENFNFHQVVDAVMASLRYANKMIEHHKPWALVKNTDATSVNELEAVLALGLESVRASALILHPIIPQVTENLLCHLKIPPDSRQWRNTEFLRSGRVAEGLEEERPNNLIFFKRIK